MDRIKAMYGYDKPLWERYITMVGNTSVLTLVKALTNINP